MGRQSAGAAFLQAVADTQPEQLWCYAPSNAIAEDCAANLKALGASQTRVTWIPVNQPERLSEVGLLYRPDPGIGQHGWHRLARSHPRAYSLCGVTMTLSSHDAMSVVADYLSAPLHSWDAVVCISTVVRDALRYVLEAQAEHLREWIGATRFTLPQMPVIPLGVHAQHYSFTTDARARARTQLGIAEDEVVVLYAGRLLAHGKAHPLPMYLALEQAATGRKIVLIQAGKAPSAEILKIFIDEPKRFCPSVRTVIVDGGNFELYRASWAAADLFTSLSDNIQESFGLTPVEAMAAALPVVVSDWNGYRDTVRDGIDGFRVPTLTLPPGSGGDLADRYAMGLDNFDYYSGYTSQLVAVDIEAAAQAYRRLIDDSALRRRMGEAGAQRVRELFDWSRVLRRYRYLWDELAERRRSDPQVTPPPSRRRRPDRPDPFAMFATYPTHHVGSRMRFRRRAGIEAADVISRRELASMNFAKHVQPNPELIASILAVAGAEWIPFDAVVRSLPGTRPDAISASLVWLCKVGALDSAL